MEYQNKGTVKLSNKQRKKRENKLYVFRNFKEAQNFELCAGPGEAFYKSTIWLKFRFDILKNRKRMCVLCGRGPGDGFQIELDHIKPRYLFPELALKEKNIQILCRECNRGKGLKEFKVRTILRKSN